MCVIGYDIDNQLFKVRNSFGKDWADNGYGYFTFDYASEYFTDM
jgi:C1A family cysteine protease